MRIEGPQSHLLRECPSCRTPLYGRFVPAPATQAPGASSSGSGIIIAVVAVLGIGLIGAVGAVGYLLSKKKDDTNVVAAPPSATAVPTPLLAETAPSASTSPSASAAPAVHKPPRDPRSATQPSPFGSSAVVSPRPTTSTIFGINQTPPTPGKCTATLSVGAFRKSSPTCSFNEKVSQGPGRLEFPCDGGSATATFGTQTFRGSVTATTVSLTQTEPFDFHGCSVVSTQRIFGSRSSNTASYSYSERTVGGSCSGVSTCTATATVDIR